MQSMGISGLYNLPFHCRINVGGLNNLQPGIYAVVEASVLVHNAMNWSGQFEKWLEDIHNYKELRDNGELEEDDEVLVASKANDVASDDESDEEKPDAPISNYQIDPY